MAEINPVKLQKPLKDKDGSFYPLTTYDQIIMPDGFSRWDGSSDGVYVERNSTESSGLPAPSDADTLGGIPAKDYALKTDIATEASNLPVGGTSGQILAKVSNANYDATWIDANTNTTVDWSEIQNVPTEFPPTEHTHDFESCGLKIKNGITMRGSERSGTYDQRRVYYGDHGCSKINHLYSVIISDLSNLGYDTCVLAQYVNGSEIGFVAYNLWENTSAVEWPSTLTVDIIYD